MLELKIKRTYCVKRGREDLSKPPHERDGVAAHTEVGNARLDHLVNSTLTEEAVGENGVKGGGEFKPMSSAFTVDTHTGGERRRFRVPVWWRGSGRYIPAQ